MGATQPDIPNDRVIFLSPQGEMEAMSTEGNDGAGAENVGETAMKEELADTTSCHHHNHEGKNHQSAVGEHRERSRHRKRRKERSEESRSSGRRERMSTSPVNYLADPRKRVGRDYENWHAGTTVSTPERGLKLTILRRIDDGHAGVVFKVRDEQGSIFALKVPRKESEKQFKKLHQEVAKNARLLSLDLPVAEIIEEGGDYLVKRWVDGLRGDHWFIQWNEKGRPLDDPAWKQLCEMFDRLSAMGVYVQNLKDLNVIYDGQRWVVIDVGYFKSNLTPQQALGRYYETFDDRWNKSRYNRGRFMFLCPPIASLRGHGPQHYVKRDRPQGYYKKKPRSLNFDEANGTNFESIVPPMSPSRLGADGRPGPLPNAAPGKGTASEALNEIKRKQAEAALAVLEEAKIRKKKKQLRSAIEAVETAEGAATSSEKKDISPVRKEDFASTSGKKRSEKDEGKEKKESKQELRERKERELKEKKEKKEKERKEKAQQQKEQKEKKKKEKEKDQAKKAS